MKIMFYPRLAWSGIKNNKRIYIPYILAGSIMVMMYYILVYLTETPALSHMQGSASLRSILTFGSNILAIFSLLFLFYTNSFLIKQRYRELGLYNVLGMNKRNIRILMFFEGIFVAAVVLLSGCVLGIGFSKISELVFMNLLNIKVDYNLYIGKQSLVSSLIVFGAIYLLLLLKSFISVGKAKPLDLLKSSKVGEQIPKRNYLFAVAGVIILGFAYYLSVSIEEPLTALVAFSVAVVLVIIATYLLFISGSVSLCKILQKNKKFYYKPNHFVPVSNMMYRMKRNGAGLASICILLTMVLVTVGVTSSLYFGLEDALNSLYPRDVNVSVMYKSPDAINEENIKPFREIIKKETGISKNLEGVKVASTSGLFTENGILLEEDENTAYNLESYDNLGFLNILSLEDYNKLSDEKISLGDKECYLHSNKLKLGWKSFSLSNENAYKVKGFLKEGVPQLEDNTLAMPTVLIVVKDIKDFAGTFLEKNNRIGLPLISFSWEAGVDMKGVLAKEKIEASDKVRNACEQAMQNQSGEISSVRVDSKDVRRDGFVELYGSLFFLGSLLSLVFLFGAVLIIYYKQISEGYEDEGRFAIMQKVGMTNEEIHKSINSQMLTVFFAPIILAGIHLCFAFPFVWKILMMFGLNNLKHIIFVLIVTFAIISLVYAVVYKLTSNAYYSIVTRKQAA